MMKGVGELPDDAVRSEFNDRSCCVKIMGYQGAISVVVVVVVVAVVVVAVVVVAVVVVVVFVVVV